MRLGLIGLGRMGSNMARRLARGGHQVVVYNRTLAKAEALAAEEPGIEAAADSVALVAALAPPRVVWLMLPAEGVAEHLRHLAELCQPGDTLVDGANGRWQDAVERGARLAGQGFHFLDAGVSGGIWGLAEGYCLMVGGETAAFKTVEPLLATLAQPGGYLHSGPAGSGHFVKMVHNAIEYGMMQAYAEGFELLRSGPFAAHHDLAAICGLWRNGSVVRSWLLDLAQRAFERDPGLDELSGYVEDSGEGRWAVEQALNSATSAPVITLALMERFASRNPDAFGRRVLVALRREFGGHAVKPGGGEK